MVESTQDNFTLWYKYVREYQEVGLRKGQSYMNALGKIDPQLYCDWTGKDWDCFYVDDKCDLFLEKLYNVWGTI